MFNAVDCTDTAGMQIRPGPGHLRQLPAAADGRAVPAAAGPHRPLTSGQLRVPGYQLVPPRTASALNTGLMARRAIQRRTLSSAAAAGTVAATGVRRVWAGRTPGRPGNRWRKYARYGRLYGRRINRRRKTAAAVLAGSVCRFGEPAVWSWTADGALSAASRAPRSRT